MKTEDTYQPRPITAIMDEAREEFKKAYGRLLTEEEAIKLTDEIREALREEGEL
jgi:hypothetical protein